MQPTHPTLSAAAVRRAARRVLTDWPASLDRLLAEYRPTSVTRRWTLHQQVGAMALARAAMRSIERSLLPLRDPDVLGALALLVGLGGVR